MRSAIPFEILLLARETEQDFIPEEEVLGRFTRAFPDAETDRARGRREVLQRMQELLDMGTPELLVRGHPLQAERTTYAAVCWSNWPGKLAWGHLSGLDTQNDGLYFYCETPDFLFLKFAADQLATAFNMTFLLRTPYNKAIETESWPSQCNPLEWIRARYATLDDCTGILDPETNTFVPLPRRIPNLEELADWPVTLRDRLCHYLHGYHQRNSEAMAHGFASYEDYASAYVRELHEFANVRHCWSVKLDQSFHNEILVDHGEWLTRINLSGVAPGLL